VDKYKIFKDRLKLKGPIADFSEFSGVISYLIRSIFQDYEVYLFFKDTVIMDQLINKLSCVNITERFNYPYKTSILMIEYLLEILDIYYRDNKKHNPYYHTFRYRSYMTTLLDSTICFPNNIIFPTFYKLGAIDPIKIRCVSIFFMGVSKSPIYIYQYLNTPLEFFSHDIQHTKRKIQETMKYYDLYVKHSKYYSRRTLFDIISEDDFYNYMHSFTVEKILHLIDYEENDDEIYRAIKDISKIIIFEVIHEKGWPITRKSLYRNDEFPVENLSIIDDNLKAYHYLFSDPTTLANVISKLQGGFYDRVENVNNKIVDVHYRTLQNISLVARDLILQLTKRDIDIDYINTLCLDKSSTEEFLDTNRISIPNRSITVRNYPETFSGEETNSVLDTKFTSHISKRSELHKMKYVKGKNVHYDDF